MCSVVFQQGNTRAIQFLMNTVVFYLHSNGYCVEPEHHFAAIQAYSGQYAMAVSMVQQAVQCQQNNCDKGSGSARTCGHSVWKAWGERPHTGATLGPRWRTMLTGPLILMHSSNQAAEIPTQGSRWNWESCPRSIPGSPPLCWSQRWVNKRQELMAE